MTIAEAKTYLNQYRQAVSDLDYLARKLERLSDRAYSIKSSSYFETGWTGKYDRAGRKIMAPVEGRGSGDIESKSAALAALALQKKEYEQKRKAVEALRSRLESEIDACCTGAERQILKYRYVLLMQFEDIAKELHYSRRGVYRAHERGLELFAESVHSSAPKCT